MTNFPFRCPGSSTTSKIAGRAAKLCANWGTTWLVSGSVKRIRTEEPDAGVPHVRVCGEGAGWSSRQGCNLAGESPAMTIVRVRSYSDATAQGRQPTGYCVVYKTSPLRRNSVVGAIRRSSKYGGLNIKE